MIPKAITAKALPLKANVGRVFDSQGKHIAFFLHASDGSKVFRSTVGGMLALLRQIPLDGAN